MQIYQIKTKLFLRSIFSTFATLEISKTRSCLMWLAFGVWWCVKPTRFECCVQSWRGNWNRVLDEMGRFCECSLTCVSHCFTIFCIGIGNTHIGTGTCVFFVKMPPIDLTHWQHGRSRWPLWDPNPSAAWTMPISDMFEPILYDVQCSRETMTVSNEEKLGSYSRNRPNSHNHPTNRCHLGKSNMIQI